MILFELTWQHKTEHRQPYVEYDTVETDPYDFDPFNNWKLVKTRKLVCLPEAEHKALLDRIEEQEARLRQIDVYYGVE